MPVARFPLPVLRALVAEDGSRPRLTFYDDTTGPTAGERVEVTGKNLLRWVHKAANMLVEEYDVTPGDSVRLDLPVHWRTVYWAFAVWSVGGTVLLGDRGDVADGVAPLVITDDLAAAAAAAEVSDVILVSRPALARSHPEAATVPAARDEAKDLLTMADAFEPMADPSGGDVALRDGEESLSHAELLEVHSDWGSDPRVLVSGPVGHLLRTTLAAFGAGGSVVVVAGDGGRDRQAMERVTVDARVQS